MGRDDIQYKIPSDTLVYDVGRSLLTQGKRRKPDVFSHISALLLACLGGASVLEPVGLRPSLSLDWTRPEGQ